MSLMAPGMFQRWSNQLDYQKNELDSNKFFQHYFEDLTLICKIKVKLERLNIWDIWYEWFSHPHLTRVGIGNWIRSVHPEDSRITLYWIAKRLSTEDSRFAVYQISQNCCLLKISKLLSTEDSIIPADWRKQNWCRLKISELLST